MTNLSKLSVDRMSPPFHAGARVMLLITLLAGLGLLAPNAVPSTSAHLESATVERLLNPDGTLNLSAGGSGALDLRGWDVTLDSNRGPVLTRQRGGSELPPKQARDPRARSGTFDPAVPLAATWQPLSNNGLNSIVGALAVSGSDIYVGGKFTQTADSLVTQLNHIAKFSGGAWSALPNDGLNGYVAALAFSGSDLYVGGLFTQTAYGAVPSLNNIAKFSEGTWSTLSHSGLNDYVTALAFSGSDLYVGGQFTQTADGTVPQLNAIAKYSGGAWSALPHNGLDGYVFALAVSGSDLYVGGFFTQTGDGLVTNLNRIAKFSGGAWSALSHNGLNDGVYALAFSGSDLYVVGQFTQTAYGAVTNLNNIAQLSGGVWSALSHNGLNSYVLALAVSGSDLYVGGAFTQSADTLVTNLNGIAKLSPIPYPPSITAQPSNQTTNSGSSPSFTAAANGDPSPSVQWQVSTNGGASFNNIGGATNTTYTFTAQASDNGNLYHAVFTNSTGSATSNNASLTVNSSKLYLPLIEK